MVNEETESLEPKAPEGTPWYVVLRATSIGSEGFTVVGETPAPNSTDAIQMLAGAEPGEYVAVPVRSFRRRVLAIEQRPVVTIS